MTTAVVEAAAGAGAEAGGAAAVSAAAGAAAAGESSFAAGAGAAAAVSVLGGGAAAASGVAEAAAGCGGGAAVFAARDLVGFVSPLEPSALDEAAFLLVVPDELAVVVGVDGAASGVPVADASDCGASAEPAGAGAGGCAPTDVMDLFSRSFAKVPSLPGPWGPRLERYRRLIPCVWRLTRADAHFG